MALLRAKKAVGRLNGDNDDVQAGINIVLKALEAPIRQIAENAGVEGSIVVGKVLETKAETFGYDAQNDEYGDMIEKRHHRSGQGRAHRLQDAASIAGLLITTEAMVAEVPKEEPPACRPRRRRNGWYGRHGLLSSFNGTTSSEGRLRAAFFFREVGFRVRANSTSGDSPCARCGCA